MTIRGNGSNSAAMAFTAVVYVELECFGRGIRNLKLTARVCQLIAPRTNLFLERFCFPSSRSNLLLDICRRHAEGGRKGFRGVSAVEELESKRMKRIEDGWSCIGTISTRLLSTQERNGARKCRRTVGELRASNRKVNSLRVGAGE